MTLISIKNVRDKRRREFLKKEISEVIEIYKLTRRKLQDYKHYINVKEVISTLNVQETSLYSRLIELEEVDK